MTENTGAAFGIETETGETVTPATINLNDWLKGATPYRKTTHMYLDAALWERCEELRREYEKLEYQRAQQADGDVTIVEEPMSGKGIEGRMQDVVNELEDTLPRLEESKRKLVIQSVGADDDERIGKLPNGNRKMFERLAVSIVEPKFTATEWGQVRDAIGESQWNQLVAVWFDVQNSGTVGADFSLPHSARQATSRS